MKDIIIKYLWIGIIMLCIFLLAGCGQVPMADRVIEQHQNSKDASTPSEAESIGNMKSIGAALGCVFAPQNCQKSK
jgi:hypothetical protein